MDLSRTCKILVPFESDLLIIHNTPKGLYSASSFPSLGSISGQKIKSTHKCRVIEVHKKIDQVNKPMPSGLRDQPGEQCNDVEKQLGK